MGLDTKVGVQAAIAARKLSIPSGVYVDGAEKHGTFTRKVMIAEVCDLSDAILALISGGDSVMASVTTWRNVITELRANKVGLVASPESISAIHIVDAAGAVQRGALLDRHPRLAGLLSAVVYNVAVIMDTAYGATDAREAALDLVTNTASQLGSSVYVDGLEVGGAVSLREFRGLYLTVLGLVADAFPA